MLAGVVPFVCVEVPCWRESYVLFVLRIRVGGSRTFCLCSGSVLAGVVRFVCVQVPCWRVSYVLFVFRFRVGGCRTFCLC